MADLVTKLKLETGEFDSNISSATSAIKLISEQAELSKKGLNDLFNILGLLEAMDLFSDVGNIINSLKDKMGQSGISIKSELKAITGSASELTMAYRNLSNEELNSAGGQALKQYIDQLIVKGGELKDVIKDTKKAISSTASDTASLSALSLGLNVVISSFGMALGAASMFGISEQTLTLIQTEMLVALAVSNGLTEIQNALLEESALRTGLSAVKTTILSTATAIKTGVTNADTIATKAAAIALAIWNNAIKENPIMALVTVIGSVIVAVYEFTKATDSQKKAEEEANKRIQDRIKLETDYKNKVSETTGSNIAKYLLLRTAWNQLGNDLNAKKKFINDNLTAFNNLGLSIGDVHTAEKIFVSNTNDVIAAFEARAQAAAAMKMLEDAYTNYYKATDISNFKYKKYNSGDTVNIDTRKKYGLNESTGDYSVINLGGYAESYKLTAKGAAKLNAQLNKESVNDYKNANKTALGELQNTTNKVNGIIATSNRTITLCTNKIGHSFLNVGTTNKHNTVTTSNHSNNSNSTPPPTPTGTPKWYDEKISLLLAKLDLTINAESRETLKAEINELSRQKIKIELEWDDNTIKDLNKKLEGNINSDITKLVNQPNKPKSLSNVAVPVNNKDISSINKYTASLEGLSSVMTSINTLTRKGASGWLLWGATLISTIGSSINSLRSLVKAEEGASLASVIKSAAELKFPANLIALAPSIAAILAAFASIPAFADGGLIGGNSFTGDKLLARVNSGELILNKKQLGNLLSAINNTNSSIVEFKIKGKDLVGAIDNFNSIKSKVK